ncbi:hypothetical protein ambt_16390 [Alteromonas naphthalenivorans]|uniref:Uncharacterized protein n=1 Tax=Alteromonas naphthalenivorans TaxID=715451 RepID=F5ZF08_ALTNA|nr:hypothetical protein ambt_16390 [Alteromonas naphthalenivorans]
MPLQNVKVITSLKTHKKDYDFSGKLKNTPEKQITADVSTEIIISGQVDYEKFADNIYCLDETDKNDEFIIVRPKGSIKVNLRSGEPARDPKDNEKQVINQGVFWGSCFRMNYDPGEDDIIFEMYMPEAQVHALAERYDLDSDAKLEVYSELASFTYEVDDSLREPYHSRDLVINDGATAFVSGVSLSSTVGPQETNEPDDSEEEFADTIIDEHESIPEQVAHQQLLQVITNLQLPLKSIITAIWALALAVIISAII